MAIALVQQATGSKTSGTTVGVTISTPAAGSCLVAVSAGNGFPSISGITGGGVTWAVLKDAGFTNWDCQIWYGLNSSGSGTSITVTYGSTNNAAVNVSEWSGIKTSGAAGTTNSGFGTSTTPSSGAVTPASAPALVIAALGRNGNNNLNGATGGGFTDLTQAAASTIRANGAYLIQPTSPASATCTWTTTSQSYDAAIAVLLGIADTTSAFDTRSLGSLRALRVMG